MNDHCNKTEKQIFTRGGDGFHHIFRFQSHPVQLIKVCLQKIKGWGWILPSTEVVLSYISFIRGKYVVVFNDLP